MAVTEEASAVVMVVVVMVVVREAAQSTCESRHRGDTYFRSNDGQRPSCRCTCPDNWVGSAPSGKPRSKSSHPPHRRSSCRPRRPSDCWCSSRQASPRGSHPREAGSAATEDLVRQRVAVHPAAAAAAGAAPGSAAHVMTSRSGPRLRASRFFEGRHKLLRYRLSPQSTSESLLLRRRSLAEHENHSGLLRRRARSPRAGFAGAEPFSLQC